MGGGMANTFLKAKGSQMGDSLVDEDNLEFAADFLEKQVSGSTGGASCGLTGYRW